MPKPSALAVALRLAPSINNAIWPSEDIDIKSTSATRKHVPGLIGRRQGKHRRAIASLLPIELGSLRPKRAGDPRGDPSWRRSSEAKEAARLRTGRPLRFSSFPVCVCQPADQTRTSGLRRLGKRLAHGLAQVRAQSGPVDSCRRVFLGFAKPDRRIAEPHSHWGCDAGHDFVAEKDRRGPNERAANCVRYIEPDADAQRKVVQQL
jgi:hypothetical protein